MKKTILGLLLIVFLLSACSTSFPSKEKVSAMTSEEATKLLLDKTQQEIRDNWGEPSNFFSGLYGDIYEYEGICIGIYYDRDSEKVINVAIWTKEDQGL